MSRLRRQIRQTLTIARRDFVATVFTPIFLLFLFAPILMGSFGALGGASAAAVSQGSADKSRLVAIATDEDARALVAADKELRALFRRDETPAVLEVRAPGADPAAQAAAAFQSDDIDVDAVLHGPLTAPRILYATGQRPARYLAAVAEAAVRTQRAGSGDLSTATLAAAPRRSSPSLGGRNASGFFAVFGVFFLTLFLAGQVVGTMAEERNNKVIEILAAAVPLESVFLGKLLGMFGVALLFVAFWGTVVSQIGALLPAGMAGAMSELRPAIGIGTFVVLFIAYFTMAYLLLGSVFLGIGAQASTMREIQMLSLPITILQMAMFGLSAAAVSRPGTWLATAAEIFPLSSPFAMAGRAASGTALWPHLMALAWQALWVAIFITVGARLFRRGVLQSGSAKPAWRAMFARG